MALRVFFLFANTPDATTVFFPLCRMDRHSDRTQAWWKTPPGRLWPLTRLQAREQRDNTTTPAVTRLPGKHTAGVRGFRALSEPALDPPLYCQ